MSVNVINDIEEQKKKYIELFPDDMTISDMSNKLDSMVQNDETALFRQEFCNELVYAITAGYIEYGNNTDFKNDELVQIFIRNVHRLPKDKCFYHTNSEVFDNQSALIIFADGSHGCFNYVIVSADPGRDITIHGTKGYLKGHFDNGELTYTIYDTNEDKKITFDNVDKHAGGDEKIIESFLVNSKDNKSDNDMLGASAYASIVAFQGDYSLYTGKMQEIPSITQKGVFVPFEEYMKNSKNLFYNTNH